MPNKIKVSLEKGKAINNEWIHDNTLGSILNDCIKIEDNIKNIHLINANIKKCKLNNDLKIEFILEEKKIDNIIQNIKDSGEIIKIKNIDSEILNKKEDLIKFYKLLSNYLEINNIQLIYKASENGLELSRVVNKINNKSNLIFVFLTGNKRIFGVFIETKLENIKHDKYYKDDNAFAFSLNNNKIYEISVPEKATRFLYLSDKNRKYRK